MAALESGGRAIWPSASHRENLLLNQSRPTACLCGSLAALVEWLLSIPFRSKKAAGRSKDLNVLPELEALKEMHAQKEQTEPPQD